MTYNHLVVLLLYQCTLYKVQTLTIDHRLTYSINAALFFYYCIEDAGLSIKLKIESCDLIDFTVMLESKFTVYSSIMHNLFLFISEPVKIYPLLIKSARKSETQANCSLQKHLQMKWFNLETI